MQERREETTSEPISRSKNLAWAALAGKPTSTYPPYAPLLPSGVGGGMTPGEGGAASFEGTKTSGGSASDATGGTFEALFGDRGLDLVLEPPPLLGPPLPDLSDRPLLGLPPLERALSLALVATEWARLGPPLRCSSPLVAIATT